MPQKVQHKYTIPYIGSNIINNTDANKSNLAYLNNLFGNIFVTFKKDMWSESSYASLTSIIVLFSD